MKKILLWKKSIGMTRALPILDFGVKHPDTEFIQFSNSCIIIASVEYRSAYLGTSQYKKRSIYACRVFSSPR